MAQIHFNNTKSMSREENSFRKTNTSTEKKIVHNDSHQTNTTFRLDIAMTLLCPLSKFWRSSNEM